MFLCLSGVSLPGLAHPPQGQTTQVLADVAGKYGTPTKTAASSSWVPAVRQSVQTWLVGMPAGLRQQAMLSLDDAARSDWHYTPRSRNGVSFKQMDERQRAAAREVLKLLLSADGLRKVTNIIELEIVLRELERFGLMRDPERYHLTVYGDPASEKTNPRWGLRFEGHHLSLNFTFVGDAAWSDTPSFLGINPARVPPGLKAGREGLRVLAHEEDLARELLATLNAPQRSRLLIADSTFGDIVTRNAPAVKALEAAGLPVSELNAAQQEQLRRLIREYAQTFAPGVAEQRLRRAEADFANIRFAWAGSLEPGKPHYYRIQGLQFLIEYDASQDGGNHIHTVWRDFNGDFGRDLLRAHYQAMAGSRHGHAH